MTRERLSRVIWRLREMGEVSPSLFSYHQVRKAIMEEIGTDERTIKTNITKILELGLLKRLNLHRFRDEHNND